jgi:ABC-type transport system involved in multi-copper enzyme maturation permease subunit
MRSLRDNWFLLAGCSLLTILFVCLRVWIASKIKFDMFIKLFSDSLSIFQDFLPVPIEDLATPLGRTAFSFEELPVILLLGLWTITRGSECIAGRVSAGTMEMLLAQPLRRSTLMATHSFVSVAGVGVLGAAAWLGIGAGLGVAQFDEPPSWSSIAPGLVQYLGLGVFLIGAATLTSALARTRSQAVGAMVAFYVVELAFLIVSALSPSARWVKHLSVLSLYEPTMLTLGMAREPNENWPYFWLANGLLFGLGIALWAIATTMFCRRDVPAPL